MSTTEAELDVNSISKMKVAELKKELKARGLSTAGAKIELMERLQQAVVQGVAQDLVSEDGNAESEILDEDEVLGDEEEGGDFDEAEADAVLEDEPKPEPVTVTAPAATKRPAPLATEPSQESQPKKRILVRPMSIGKENGSEDKSSTDQSAEEKKEAEEKKVIKIVGVPVKERLEKRAQKFGVPLSDQAKKAARAERFGITPAAAAAQSTTSSASTTTISTKIGTNKKINFEGPSADVLKKRAERFGCNVSTLAAKLEQQEKLKKRQERFGVTAAAAAPAAPVSGKISISAVTAKTPITLSDLEEKKKLRAQRFKI